MKKYVLPGTIALISIILAACTNVVSTPCPIIPLYKNLENYPAMTTAQRDSMLRADRLPLSVMFGFLGLSDTPDHQTIEKWAHSRVVEAFTPVVDSVYSNLRSTELALGQILNEAERDKLDFPPRQYAAVIWGNPRSIVMSDSCMLIALNHYLGEDFEGYNHLPEYLKSGKTPQRLPYDICEALISNRYPYVRTDDSTVLSRLLYEGAVTAAKLMLLPYNDVAESMGYTDAQLKWLTDNRQKIWNTLVARNQLYSTSANDIDRLVEAAPNTSILGAEVPPRVGRFIGYSIVVSYMQDNSDKPLSYLLSPEFYNNPSILIESAYE